ncbi:MAG: presenilin family intramembrane aspartyl protease [Candidatus Thermoplasmatota archaeon]|nr:presenilin family intramembrane aspartyl protease [Candidatus Thermoplasmatota archaeon]
MAEEKNNFKKEIIPAFLMGFLFIIVYSLVLFLTEPFITEGGIKQAFEDINDPVNILMIIVIMLVVTVTILLIAKYWKDKIIQIIILFAVGYTSFYAFFLPVLNILFPAYQDIVLISSLILAVLLVIALYKYPEWYVIDISGIIIGVGAIIIFGISLGILLVLILLIALAVYDAISVYKTKHMIDLADTVMDLKLPVLLVIPKKRGYSLLKETKRLKEKLKEGEEREAFFMGLGDIVIPGILVAAVYRQINAPEGFLISIGTIIGILIGFTILMTFVLKGKPQAGLPCLCGGAIIGYIVSSLILFGELKGLVFIF